ncbi:MAG TPA: helix-turn-helix transcriptional regulator, partial [Sphingomicrobium sp.]|nr:helix-turn-helix transcriptional regulator [Sphingomicrobium sp.]
MRVSRVRTNDWPERDRLAMFRENVGRDRVIIEPLPDEPFRIDANMTKLPGLGLISSRRSALRSDFAYGDDRLMINLGGPALAVQTDSEVVLERGDAIAFRGADVGSYTTSLAGRIATIEFPDGSLARLLSDGAMRKIPAGAPALQLLRRYLNGVQTSELMQMDALRPLAIAHIHDLAALALGASREAEEIANGRGVRAARLQAIKGDILSSLQDELMLDDVAARHRLSPRYVRMLFESEGTSFSEFVREERLKRAHRMLISRRFDHYRISEIAYEVGFNDLSYFNRSFRRRFGCSPGETRESSWP